MRLSDLPPGVSVNDPHINPPGKRRRAAPRDPLRKALTPIERSYLIPAEYAPDAFGFSVNLTDANVYLVESLLRPFRRAARWHVEVPGTIGGYGKNPRQALDNFTRSVGRSIEKMVNGGKF